MFRISIFFFQHLNRSNNLENAATNAMVAFLSACRHQNENKSRKFLSKVIWLLSFDDNNNTALADALDKVSSNLL